MSIVEQQDLFGVEETGEYLEAFNVHSYRPDEDDDTKFVDLKDLVDLLYMVGINATEAEIQVMTDDVDPDKTGLINFEGFLGILKEHLTGPKTEQELRESFDVFDKEGNNFISTRDLRYISRHLGLQYADVDIDDMMKEADIDGDGRISFEDFSYIMTAKR